MRFSLKWMLAAVAFVGVGSVALFTANEVWAMATMALTVIVLLVAVVGAFHSNSRAFCTGICVFGWGYLYLTYIPPARYAIRPLAATDALLDVMYPYDLAPPREVFENALHAIDPNAPPTPNLPPTLEPHPEHFRAIGHSLFALVFAIIGGAVGQWFSRQCNTASER